MAIKHSLELVLEDTVQKADLQEFIDAVPEHAVITRHVSVSPGDRNMMDTKRAKLVASW